MTNKTTIIAPERYEYFRDKPLMAKDKELLAREFTELLGVRGTLPDTIMRPLQSAKTFGDVETQIAEIELGADNEDVINGLHGALKKAMDAFAERGGEAGEIAKVYDGWKSSAFRPEDGSDLGRF